MVKKALKSLKWVLVGLLGLMLLVVIAFEVISWNFLRTPIEERIETATGRQFEIRGDLDLSLLPQPHASVSRMEFGNPEWASAGQMLSVEQLGVSLSWAELVRGELVLSEVNIDGPILNLEERTEGSPNWVLQAMAEAQTPEGEKGAQEAGLPVLVRELNLSGARISYLAPEADTPKTLSIPSLQVQDDGVTLQTSGTVSFRDREFALDADTDSLVAFRSGSTGYEGQAEVASGDSSVQISFLIPEAPKISQLETDFQVSLRNPGEWSEWMNMPALQVDTLELSGSLERKGARWHLREMNVRSFGSQITGELTLDAGDRPLVINGQLHSPEFNVENLMAALPEPDEQSEQLTLSIPPLPSIETQLSLSIDRLLVAGRSLENLEAGIELADQTLNLEPLKFGLADGRVEGNGVLASNSDRVSASTSIAFKNLDLARLDMGPEQGSIPDGKLAIELKELARQEPFAPEILLENLRISDSRVFWLNEAAGTSLDASVQASGDNPAPVISLDGSFQTRPIAMSVEGAPLPQLVTNTENYRLLAQATSGSLRAWADTTLGALLEPESMAGNLVLEDSDGKDLETWVGQVLPPLPEFRLKGRLDREGELWSVTGLDGKIGTSEVAGEVHYTNSERPLVRVNLDAGRITLSQFRAENTEGDGESDNGSDATSESAAESSVLAPLRIFDADMVLRADALVLPDENELRELSVRLTLDEGRARLEPLEFKSAGGSLEGALALDARKTPASGRLDAEFENIELSRLADTFSAVEDRLGRLSGALALDIEENSAVDRRDDLLLPFIGRVIFDQSRLNLHDDKTGTDMTLHLVSHNPGTGNAAFHVDGEGRYDGDPFSLRFRADPLLNIRDPDRPFALDMKAEIVESEISLAGSILQPLALKGLDLDLALQGPNPQRLSRLLGVPLPLLPPYSVSGNLELRNERWAFTDLDGIVGDSDLQGEITFDASTLPPHLAGNLKSTSLDIADLGGLVGKEPPGSPTEQEEDSKDRFVLPDQPLVTDAWLDLSADVQFRGESVRARDVPLSNVVLNFTLEDGLGRFHPISFGVGSGHIDYHLELDARKEPPEGTMNVEVQAVDLQEALRNWEIADESIGTVGARGKFWVEGASIADLLGSSDGGLTMLMTGGRLDALLVELAGLDVYQAFLSWVRGRDPIPIDCAYIDLKTRDGIAELDTFVIDTDDTSFSGGGKVNLNTEELDITFLAHPKDVSVLSARTPLHLGGTFGNVEPTLYAGKLSARTGAGAALAAVAGPLVAMLPLLDLGTGEEIDYCEGLVSRTREALENTETEQ
ncbi:AsmA family protein [Marinobacter sp.]|uniref:AsmA family protein n=1 Tax=Marinobacter sp. TaxID=50741 RepID=UPI00384E0407